MFTKRNIVKFAKDQLIVSAAASATRAAVDQIVEDPTELQETGIDAGCLIVGYAVRYKLKERTDQMIDSIADWRQNRKVAKTVTEVVA